MTFYTRHIWFVPGLSCGTGHTGPKPIPGPPHARTRLTSPGDAPVRSLGLVAVPGDDRSGWILEELKLKVCFARGVDQRCHPQIVEVHTNRRNIGLGQHFLRVEIEQPDHIARAERSNRVQAWWQGDDVQRRVGVAPIAFTRKGAPLGGIDLPHTPWAFTIIGCVLCRNTN